MAGDPEVLALVDTLPEPKRQPNLVLAAARWHGAAPGPYDGLRRVLLDRWDDVRATVLGRATQTNEVGRCAVLLPVLLFIRDGVSPLFIVCSVSALFVFWTHRANIERLRQGTENRFGKREGKRTPVVLIAVGVVSVLALYTVMRPR